jgi:hypothetical protein
VAREIVGSGSASYQQLSEGEDKVVALLILLLRLAVTGGEYSKAYKRPQPASPDPELNQSLVVAASQYPNSAKPSLISETQAIGRRPKEQVQRPALPPERSFGVLVVPSQGNSNQPIHLLSS